MDALARGKIARGETDPVLSPNGIDDRIGILRETQPELEESLHEVETEFGASLEAGVEIEQATLQAHQRLNQLFPD